MRSPTGSNLVRPLADYEVDRPEVLPGRPGGRVGRRRTFLGPRLDPEAGSCFWTPRSCHRTYRRAGTLARRCPRRSNLVEDPVSARARDRAGELFRPTSCLSSVTPPARERPTTR